MASAFGPIRASRKGDKASGASPSSSPSFTRSRRDPADTPHKGVDGQEWGQSRHSSVAGRSLSGEAFGDERLVLRRRRSSFLFDLGEQPDLHRRRGAVSFRIVVRQTARLDDDEAQLGDAAATMIVEVNKGKAGARHSILEERDRRRRRKAMLAAQMQKSTDEAVAAVSVVITAARPVAVIREKLDHQIEQLHGFADVCFGHWFDRSRSRGMRQTITGDHGLHRRSVTAN